MCMRRFPGLVIGWELEHRVVAPGGGQPAVRRQRGRGGGGRGATVRPHRHHVGRQEGGTHTPGQALREMHRVAGAFSHHRPFNTPQSPPAVLQTPDSFPLPGLLWIAGGAGCACGCACAGHGPGGDQSTRLGRTHTRRRAARYTPHFHTLAYCTPDAGPGTHHILMLPTCTNGSGRRADAVFGCGVLQASCRRSRRRGSSASSASSSTAGTGPGSEHCQVSRHSPPSARGCLAHQ